MPTQDRITPETRLLQVNINKASEEQLKLLPHVGPVLAKRIIEYREKNGPYLLKEDLKKVKGISGKTFDHLKGFITTQ